jgi:hypothetical protein
MSSYNYSYNVLINRLEVFAAGHFMIRRFTHGQIDLADQLQNDQYPFMHVVPEQIRPVDGGMQFDFLIMFADIPRDKEYKAEYQREVISDCVRLGQDLVAEVKNGLQLFGFDVQLTNNPTFEPFMEEQKNTVTGVTFTLSLEVPWDWSACDIPAIWTTQGASSGGSANPYGITLRTNGVNNQVQNILDLVQGSNITITDNGDGSVTIDATGGNTTDYVSTEWNANHTTAQGNPYQVGDRVWYNGSVYVCIANNDAINPSNPSYWTLLAVGGRLRQTPVDWNATSGDYQILNKPTIPVLPGNIIEDVTASAPILSSGGTTPDISIPAANLFQDGYLTSADFTAFYNKFDAPTGASSDYLDGTGTPTPFPSIPPAQVNSDWNSSSGLSQILNKPSIPSVLNDLTDVDTTGQSYQKVLYYDGTQWIPYLLAKVAYSGSYADLKNPPAIPKTLTDLIGSGVNVGDIIQWNGSAWVIATPSWSLEKLSDVNVAGVTDGQVLTWDNVNGEWIPTTPSFTQVNADWNATSGAAEILNKPTIPAAQVNSDWNASSGLAQILNKPTIPAAQIQSDWNQSNISALDYIKNKPSIGAGSVTSVGTAGLISGGPITTSGTITTSMNTSKLVGRYTAGSGIMEEISVGSGLTLTGAGVLNNTATPTPTGYYGAWQDNNTQTAVASNIGYAMIFSTVDLSNGVTVVTNGTNLTRITFANTGIYNLQFSSQFQNTNNALEDVSIWLRKNGADVAGSSGFISVPQRKNPSEYGHVVVSWNYLLSVVAGEYYELVWSTTNHTTVTMQYYAAGSPPPSTASVILTVTQQAGIMAGTGITAINSLTGAAQTIGVGTSGTDFAVSSSGTAHTLNLPTASASNRGALSSADWSTFNGKQAALVSGSTIKTINSTSLLGSGDVVVQPTLVSGTNIKTVNSTSLLGSGDVAVQATLVSGTNIKTINSTSLLGSGNIAIATTDSTVFSGNPNATQGQNSTAYWAISGSLAPSSTENFRNIVMPVAGTLKNLYIRNGTTQSGTGSIVFTLRKNGVDTAITVTFTNSDGATATKSDTTNTVSVAAGDLICLKAVNNAPGSASGNIVSFSILLER